MPTADTVVVNMVANLDNYERNMARAEMLFNRTTRAIEDKGSRLGQGFGNAFISSSLAIQTALSGIIALLGANQFRQFADEWTDISNNLKLAEGRIGEVTYAQDRLLEIVQKTGTPMLALTRIMTSAARSRAIEADANAFYQFAEAVAIGTKIAVTGADQARGALFQLSQAIGSPRVQLEEFNSVVEGTPRLAQAFADGIEEAGGDIAKLRKLIGDGNVSGRDLFRALITQLPKLQAEYAKVAFTTRNAFQILEDSIRAYVGRIDQAYGVTRQISNATIYLAKNIEQVGKYALAAGVALAALVGPTMLASVGGLVGRVLMMAGPWGLVITAIAGASAALYAFQDDIRPVAGELATIGDIGEEIAARLASSVNTISDAYNRAFKNVTLSISDALTSTAQESDSIWDEILSQLKSDINELIGVVVSAAILIKASYTSIPLAIGEAMIDTVNGIISSIERMLNTLIEGVNAFAAQMNDTVGGIFGIAPQQQKPLIEPIELGRVEQAWKGAGEVAAQAFIDAHDAATKDYLKEWFKDVDGADIMRGANRRAEERRYQEFEFRRADAFTRLGRNDVGPLDPITLTGPGRTGSSSSRGVANPIVDARKLAGLREESDAAVLSNFFREANVNIDPRITAWCAAFVNAVLATNGLKGTGSLAARSFLGYGENVDGAPQTGDIVVLKRGTDPRKGHVGFFEGYDSDGNVRVLGGNQGGKGTKGEVSAKSFPSSDVLGFRRIPGVRPGESDALQTATEAAQKNIRELERMTEAETEAYASSEKRIKSLGQEADTLGYTAAQLAKYNEEQALRNELSQAGIPITEELEAYIQRQGDRAAEAAGKITQMKQAYEGVQESNKFFAESITTGITGVLTGVTSIEDAFRNLARTIAEAGLQALLLGSGPLATIFGTAPATAGGLGGIFGALFGGIGANANGTAYWRGGATLVGERGPEIVNLPQGAKVTPNHRLPRVQMPTANMAGSESTIRMSVDLRGANGDETIRKISREAAAEGAREAVKATNKMYPQRAARLRLLGK